MARKNDNKSKFKTHGEKTGRGKRKKKKTRQKTRLDSTARLAKQTYYNRGEQKRKPVFTLGVR